MGGIGSPGAASGKPGTRQKVTGAWAGYLIFALCLLILIFFDAQAAYNHSWVQFTGITVVTLAFVVVPTGGVKWLRRSLRGRTPPAGPLV
jgi:protein-S-isoprenylcysteine O-methyltransferase Ste14